MAITLKDYAAQIQDPLRQGIVDMLWQSSRIMPLLHFIQWNGLTYPYSKRTKRPGVGTRSLNSTFTVAQGVYSPDVETLTILGGKTQADTILMELKPQLRENEIAGLMESAGLMFDRLFIKGDPSVTGKANEFYGLYARCPAAQKIAAGANGAVVTTDMVDQLLDMVSGPNSQKALFMNRTNRRNLSASAVGKAGGAGVFDVGQQRTDYNGAKIVEVEKDETDTDILPFTETQGSSNVTSTITCVRLGGAVDERDVQGILSSNLKVSPPLNYGEYIQDTVQMLGGIGIFGGYSIAQLTGCKAS